MKRMALFLSILTLLLLTTYQDSSAQQPSQKVYWMAIIEVPLGKLPAYHTFAEKELIPPITDNLSCPRRQFWVVRNPPQKSVRV